MIFGIGTDIVEVVRIENALQKHGSEFAKKILTEQEFNVFAEKKYSPLFLAKRFAAKEAAAKAFGTGFRDGLSLLDIEVYNTQSGAPNFKFYARAKNLVAINQISNVKLSLSDEKHYAIAFVTMEYNPDETA